MRIALFIFGLALSCSALADSLPLGKIKLPPGFHIALAAHVPNARGMALGAKGTLFVGSMREGKVYALKPGSTKPLVIATGLDMPVGVAFHDGDLYISAVDRIVKLPDIEAHLEQPPQPVAVRADLPPDTHHGWRYIAFGPDNKLYVSIGAPCNICETDPKRYARILRMKPDGSDEETVAQGVRMSVGFDWQPGSGKFWFTNNGRDWLGDNKPDDTLNWVDRPGAPFGFPYCHAGNVPDPEFGDQHPCSEFSQPAARLGAHVAPLGLRFYTGKMFPPHYRQQIFIAEHGSWNRSSKVGYRIVLAQVEGERITGQQVFASGWLQGRKAWGRPVDLLVAPDGALLVSDDHAGAIYRISYK
jgi:glucose/arabinose dehydrogenase